MMTSHSKGSLNPEFDEANTAILANMKSDELVCDRCGEVYLKSDGNKAGFYCVEKALNEVCNGILVEVNMIKLPQNVKTGKKNNYPYQGGNSWQGGGQQQQQHFAHDHPGDKVIFEFNGKSLFASNTHSLREYSSKWDLIIDLAGVVSQVSTKDSFIGITAPKRFVGLKKWIFKEKTVPSEVLRLHWTDMGIPPVGLDFWLDLWELLPAKTVIACFGGHGRTGTCIGSLMIAAGIDYYSAITTVRTEHCEKAVETTGQEQYLHALYADMLVRQMEKAKANNDLNEVKDLTIEIEYALKHKPNHMSSLGEESKPLKTNGVTFPYETKSMPFNQTVAGSLADSTQDVLWKDTDKRTKISGDKIYVEECINTTCVEFNCKEPSHLGWVPWDYSEEALGV